MDLTQVRSVLLLSIKAVELSGVGEHVRARRRDGQKMRYKLILSGPMVVRTKAFQVQKTIIVVVGYGWTSRIAVATATFIVQYIQWFVVGLSSSFTCWSCSVVSLFSDPFWPRAMMRVCAQIAIKQNQAGA